MLTVEQAMPLLLEHLRDALEAQDRKGGLCFIGALPGAQVPIDYVTSEEGMAWVRLASAHPTTSFPQQASTPSNCAASLALSLEVGIMRPAHVPQTFGSQVSLPGDVDQFSDTMEQLSDMRAMRTALARLADDADVLILGNYTPVGPEGVAVGGVWTFSLGED